MTEPPIDTAELRLLSNIIALVLDEQPGQAAAALEALRRRAAAGRVTGGALKNVFERITSDDAFSAARSARAGAQRLQADLDAAAVQASRLLAENAALQQRLAEAERNVVRYEVREVQRRGRQSPALQFKPAPRSQYTGGLVAGVLMTLMAIGLERDHGGGPKWRYNRLVTQPEGSLIMDETAAPTVFAPVRLTRGPYRLPALAPPPAARPAPPLP